MLLAGFIIYALALSVLTYCWWRFTEGWTASLHDTGSDLTETHEPAALLRGGSGSLTANTAGSRVSVQPPHAAIDTRNQG